MALLLDDLASVLVAASAAPGGRVYRGAKANIPAGDGPFVGMTQTPGLPPSRIQNQSGRRTERPMVQVVARAKTYEAAEVAIRAAFNALDGIWNVEIGGTLYLSITARQQPGDIGTDDVGRQMMAFNLDCERNP